MLDTIVALNSLAATGPSALLALAISEPFTLLREEFYPAPRLRSVSLHQFRFVLVDFLPEGHAGLAIFLRSPKTRSIALPPWMVVVWDG